MTPWYKSKYNIKLDGESTPSENNGIPTYWTCHNGAPYGGTILKDWTNMELRKTSDDSSGNSKTNTVHPRWTRFRTPKNK